MKDIEVWKPVVGFEGLYEVSSHGRVKSLDRVVKFKSGYEKKWLSIIKKASLNDQGYYYISMSKNGNSFSKKIHRLVADAFLEEKISKQRMVVDHRDNNPLNNRADNLQRITQRENSTRKQVGCSSKYIGVSWNKNTMKWKSQILFNKKPVFLGYFKNEIDAHNAYQNKLKEITDC